MSPITSSLDHAAALDVLSFLAALDEPTELQRPVLRLIQGGAQDIAPAPEAETPPAPKYETNYVKTTGEKFNHDLDVADVAKLVRADIKTWIATNPSYKGTKIAVTIERYSMGCSLRIKVKTLPTGTTVYTEEGLRRLVQSGPAEYTEESRHLLDELERIGASYQQKEVESQTDYYNTNYHLSVDMHWELTSAEVNAYRAARKAQA